METLQVSRDGPKRKTLRLSRDGGSIKYNKIFDKYLVLWIRVYLPLEKLGLFHKSKNPTKLCKHGVATGTASGADIFYNDDEARKYTSSSRIIDIQEKLSERAVELLALPNDGVPRLLLDIGCGSGLSGETLTESGNQWIGLDISESMLNIALERDTEGDLILGDMGQGLGVRPGVIGGAISISAVQWLCNADRSSHEPRLRLKAFFGSLYRCLARGARAVLQVYPENLAQRELILGLAMRAGFSGGVVVDFPHSTKKRKEFLVLSCGPPSLRSFTQQAKGEDGESCSDDEDSSEGEEDESVSVSDRHRPRKKQKVNKKVKGRQWVLGRKEKMRRKGTAVPADSKYTARKRKARF